MRGEEVDFIRFMEGRDKRFVIPVYQRNYDWKIANCRQLYDDLVKVIKNDRKSHFFGSIVSVYDNKSNPNKQVFLIIDGQQRLTTVSLLLLAIHNLLIKDIAHSENKYLAEQIYTDFLIDKYEHDETRIKLKPVKNDNDAFHKLFEDEEKYYKNSNLTINYMYFYNRIQKEEISLDDLYTAISRLQIINIKLDETDNPQLIFESLNSTGVNLSEGDKIRNYVLMGQPADKQEIYYEKYWNPIEILTNYNVSMFIRDYLSVKTQVTPSVNKIYADFKEYVSAENPDMETLLKNMLQYAKYYAVLLKGEPLSDSVDKKLAADIKNIIGRLNWLSTTVTRPFLLEVFRLREEGSLTWKDVEYVFRIIESYLIRRNICEVPTNALNKIFLTLHREIIKYDGTARDYVEKMKYTLSIKRESGRYPKDEEFIPALSDKNVYGMASKYRTYMLERYENAGIHEGLKDVYEGLKDGTYSIEHIMPQHLTPAWIDDLSEDGRDAEEVHTIWLHRLANLTLTSFNSSYSNERFIVKRDLVDKETGDVIGYAGSGLSCNKWIGTREKWTEKELEERNQLLLDKAKRIWPLFPSSFKPKEKPLDSVTLDEDVDLTGKNILKFSYKGIEQPVASWADAYQKVIKILHQQDESVLNEMAFSSETDKEFIGFFIADKNKAHAFVEIDDGIVLNTNLNTNVKISYLQKLFKRFGEEPQNLTFYLKNDKKDGEQEASGKKLRINYWNFAFPLIREAFSDSESGKGCFPEKQAKTSNTISGNTGISGIYLKCYSNYDKVSVALYISGLTKEDSKRVFDNLFAHKPEIEKQLGVPLVWDREDDFRISKVNYDLPEVSIYNEDDWKQMAKFQAEWSRKFYDAFIPYLKTAWEE